MKTMTLRHPLCALAVLIVLPALARAQEPRLEGPWKIDRAKNEATVRAAGPGRAGGPPANNLTVKISPTEVAVDSDTGSNRTVEVFHYVLDGKEHEQPGPLSWTTLAKSAWEGNKLVVNIKRTIEGPSGPITIQMKDVFSMEGDHLVIERSQGRDSWKTYYSKS
jgi:hypothetical protein